MTGAGVWSSPLALIVRLNDLDLLLGELAEPAGRARLKKLGFSSDGATRVEVARQRLAAEIDRRWMTAYERAHQRYGRAVASVRDRVCLGCYVTLPTTARPGPGGEEPLTVCQSCGRILYWG